MDSIFADHEARVKKMNEEFDKESKAMNREFNRIVGGTMLAILAFCGLFWWSVHKAVEKFDANKAARDAGAAIGGISKAFSDGLKESAKK